jgi:hypothetical protein
LVLQKTGVHGFDIGQAMNVFIDPHDAYVFDAAGALLRSPLNPSQGGH